MIKKAPGWGKAIGIIMICLGGLGIFYQLYKIIIPVFLTNFPIQAINDVSRLNPSAETEEALRVFDVVMGNRSQGMLLLGFGTLGILLTIPYIIAGVKLLTPKKANYNLAKYVLIIFVAYNAIEGIVLFSGNAGFFIKMILVYSIIGFVFDIVLLIILLSSDKMGYGFDRENSEMDTLYVDDEDPDVF